ncbi:MAG: type II toxin-antitoxin system RelE/ParE family toxin [Candidatus Micrarchaeota archaeon]
MRIEFSLQAEKSFSAIDKPIRERMLKKLLEIEKDPARFIQDLKGLPFDKIRIGDYRLFVKFEPQRSLLFIADIKHRSVAYK